MPSWSEVAVAAIAGEGAARMPVRRSCSRRNDVGWTISSVAACYRVGEAMGSTEFNELDGEPDRVSQAVGRVARNAADRAA